MDLEKVAKVLDLINMYVGVYYDKYIGFSYPEYLKWSYFGYSKRLELFASADRDDVINFVEKFIRILKSDCYISKYEFYRIIGSERIGLKRDQCNQFVEMMLVRENLLKFTARYNDLTGGPQYGTSEISTGERRTLFETDERNRKEKYGYEVDGVFFYKELHNEDLEDEIVLLKQSLDNRQCERRIEDFDKLIEENCEIAKNIFKTKKHNETSEPILKTRTFAFNNLISWDHQLNSWVKEFKAQHGYFPNIALASTETYGRIDLVVNASGKDHLRNAAGENAPEAEFVSMNGFQGEGYELDFCMDDNLGLDSVKLIYDSDPDGGLPIPVELEELNNKKAG